jgi:hypothetical protein
LTIDIALVGQLPIAVVEKNLPARIAAICHIQDRTGVNVVIARHRGARYGMPARRDHLLGAALCLLAIAMEKAAPSRTPPFNIQCRG